MEQFVHIDGSSGEGGGQILRSSIALSAVTARPVRVENIRAGRPRPGLMRQHLAAVKAAAAICGAKVEGAALGSRAVSFTPGDIRPGEYRFAVGTAGSSGLVLQTVLPPLLAARGTSHVVIEGGTHNPSAPPFDFLERSFVPLLRRMGARIELKLERHGFYPAGGGRIEVQVEGGTLQPLELLDRGELRRRSALALVSNLPRTIGTRELKVVCRKLGWEESSGRVEEVASPGPGNALMLEFETEKIVEVVTVFGRVGASAERVAEEAVAEAREWLASGVPVGRHLADQLLLPMALAKGGSFRTLPPSRHARTNAEVIARFLDVSCRFDLGPDRTALVTVERTTSAAQREV